MRYHEGTSLMIINCSDVFSSLGGKKYSILKATVFARGITETLFYF